MRIEARGSKGTEEHADRACRRRSMQSKGMEETEHADKMR